MASKIKHDYKEATQIQKLCAEFGRLRASPEIVAVLKPVVEADLAQNKVTEGSFLNLVMALRRMGKMEEYRLYVGKAYAIAPNSITVAREKINLLTHDGNNEAARRVALELENDPDLKEESAFARARLFREQGKFAEGFSLLENYIADNKDASNMMFLEVGVMARRYMGDLQKSVAYHERVIETHPFAYAVSLVDYADTLVETDPETAFVMREKALQVFRTASPDKRKEHTKMINFLSQAILSPQSSLKYSLKEKRWESDSSSVTGSIGKIVSETIQEAANIVARSDEKSALKYLTDVMKEKKISPPALLERASGYALRIGYHTLAEKFIDMSLSQSNKRSASLHLKAIILTRTGRDSEALDFAQRLYAVAPHNKDGALMLSIGLATQKKYEDMLKIIKPFLERIKSGQIFAQSAYEFIALQSACSDKIAAKEFRKDFTLPTNLQYAIGTLAKQYRDDLGLKDDEVKKPKLEPLTSWEVRLTRAYGRSRFWDMAHITPVDRVAARVVFSPKSI